MTAAITTVAASRDASPAGALGSTCAWGWSRVAASALSIGPATTGAGIGAVGCAFRMLSKARVQGRHSVDPGSDRAPQLSHGPTVSATVGACERSTASAPGASVSLPPQNGQNLALSTTVVWQWSQYTRCSPALVAALTPRAAEPWSQALCHVAYGTRGRRHALARGCRSATGCVALCSRRERARQALHEAA